MSGTFDVADRCRQRVHPGDQLSALPSGKHTIYVHGQDANDNWGGFSAAILNLDKAGPVTTGLTLTPNPSNGSVSVALSGTGNDTTTGNERHRGRIHHRRRSRGSHDAGWGCSTYAQPHCDHSGWPRKWPACGRRAQPGRARQLGRPRNDHAQRGCRWPVTTRRQRRQESQQRRAAAELQPARRAGHGDHDQHGVHRHRRRRLHRHASCQRQRQRLPVRPERRRLEQRDGDRHLDIPLATINALSVGNHNIYVRGKDAAGNWGTVVMALVPLLIDKTAPTFTSVTLSTTTAIVGETVTLTATGAADTGGAGLAGGQYWIDGTATPPANPTAFAGTSTNFSVPTGGVHTVYVRVGDAAGNWSAVRSATLTVPSAVNDALTLTANNNATQTSNQAAPGVLANDLPVGMAGRTATLVSGPVRTSGAGAGTISVTCGAGPATGVCANGAYRVTLNGVGNNGAATGELQAGDLPVHVHGDPEWQDDAAGHGHHHRELTQLYLP